MGEHFLFTLGGAGIFRNLCEDHIHMFAAVQCVGTRNERFIFGEDQPDDRSGVRA